MGLMHPVPEVPRIRGIDVSAAQGVIDWGAVIAAPDAIQFAWCKATDGTRGVDPQYSRNAAELRRLGLPFGAYHVAHSSIANGLTSAQDAEREAQHLVDTMGDCTLPPWVDFELNERPPKEQAEWLRAHCAEVERLSGRKPIIYTGAPMVATLMLCREWITRLPLIVAAYPQGRGANGVWSKPLTWAEAEARTMPVCPPWGIADGWQFSGGTNEMPGNRLPGIKGYVDFDLLSPALWAELRA